jgi:hypothetical protein
MAQTSLILHMPTEVLLNIFAHLPTPCITARGPVDWESYESARTDSNALQNLCNARLVCRRFCQIAAPLLLPVIQVDLNQESLDRLDALSRSPLIANGVRGIQVVLAYRSAEAAADLRRFHSMIQRDLHPLDDGYLRRGLESLSRRHQKGDASEDELLELYTKARENYRLMSKAWDEHLDGAGVHDEYVHVLLQGHLDYGKLHEEQLRLITEV